MDAFSESVAYVLSIGPGEASRIFKTTDGGGVWSWVYKADGNSVTTANYRSSWMDKS